MSIVDFSATPHHHAEILICVDVIGNISSPEFNEALRRITKHSRLAVADAGRVVHFRFQVKAPTENWKWGFFQPHRRAMGMILLAACSTAVDVTLTLEKYEKKKKNFADFIFDSRCFIFGIDNAMLQQSNAEVYQFADVDSWSSSDQDVRQFLTSVFYVLESKRVHIAADKSDRPPLLTAPFESQQTIMADTDSRTLKKKTSGRWKKHLADVSLMSGLISDALQLYQTAMELLSSSNDQVWLGGALEGVCVASAIVLYPDQLEVTPPSHEMDEKQTLDPRNLSKMNLGATSSGELSKYCVQSDDDFIELYKDAVICYTRCREMAIPEVEACIKATKILAFLNKPLRAGEFIQNAIYTSLDITNAERITKYDCMADLFKQIGFLRKSAFYKRIAAMQCVAPGVDKADWFGCNLLLQGALQGCRINLKEELGVPNVDAALYNGWPQIQLRILNELVFASRKICDNQMANRYSAHLLMKLHPHLSEQELKDCCSNLENSVNKLAHEHDTELLQLQDGTILPPINLYSLPVVSDVAAQPFEETSRPLLLNVTKAPESVFLFSPFAQSVRSGEEATGFKCSTNSHALFRIKVFNPLRVHCLHVKSLRLLCDHNDRQHLNVRCHPVTLDIDPESSVDVALMLEPRKPGIITVKGYEMEVFGIKSRCFFENIPWIKVNKFEIEVTPELPKLQRSFPHSSPKSARTNDVTITLYPGERFCLKVPLQCTGKAAVDVITLTPVVLGPTPVTSLSSVGKTSQMRRDVTWLDIKCSDVIEGLPLPGGSFWNLMISLQVEPDNLPDETDTLTSNVPRSCKGQVKVKYSTKTAAASNWCRVLTLNINVLLEPCVYIDTVSVLPSQRQSTCCVMLRVNNASGKKVRILSGKSPRSDDVGKEYEKEDELVAAGVVPSNDRIEITFQLQTVPVEGSDAWQMMCTEESMTQSSDVVLLLKQRLRDELCLEWRMGEKESLRRGVLDVTKCYLSRESCVNFMKAPLCWGISINDCDVTENLVFDATVNEPYTVRLTMTNVSGSLIPLLDVDLEIFQDQLNGYMEFNMEDCVLCLGSQYQSFDQIEAGAEIQMECILLFMLPGNYHVRLHRSSLDDVIGDGRSQTSEVTFNYHRYSPTLRVNALP